MGIPKNVLPSNISVVCFACKQLEAKQRAVCSVSVHCSIGGASTLDQRLCSLPGCAGVSHNVFAGSQLAVDQLCFRGVVRSRHGTCSEWVRNALRAHSAGVPCPCRIRERQAGGVLAGAGTCGGSVRCSPKLLKCNKKGNAPGSVSPFFRSFATA